VTQGLDRFIQAQEPVFETAMAELSAGRKTSHWMWFVFPQARSLGRSSTAAFYGIASLHEAQAYLAHPVLEERLICAAQKATTAPSGCLKQLFGSPDDLKFRSSMTLFAAVAAAPSVFHAALTRWGLSPDPLTLDLMASAKFGPDHL
jgi:uncharacterized protein (DUF1810 family)